MHEDRAPDAQLKKGILEICVLHMIREKPAYGYDVMKNVKKYFPEVNESTVYAILRRLHNEGRAQISTVAPIAGPMRKYYHLTESGKLLLEKSLASWRRLCDALKQMGL